MKKIFLIFIFLLALSLRLYKLPYLTVFNSELAENYLNIKSLLNNPVLLTGQPTSHDWLRLSSIPYYLLFPIFYLSKFHPLTGAYFWAILSSLMVLVNYYIIKKIFNGKTALMSSLFFAVSPSLINLSRLPHLYVYVIPLTYLFLWRAYKYAIGETQKLWPLFLITGLAINFHFSAIILIPLTVLIQLLRHSGERGRSPSDSRIISALDSEVLTRFVPGMTDVLKCILAFFLPNIPFLINDALHGFITTRNIFIWFPYKMMNFFKGETYGLAKTTVADNTFPAILEFFKKSLFPPDFPLWLGFLPVIIILGSLLLLKIRKHSGFQILLLWLLVGITSLFIHKNPPFHYFMPIYILPVILLSVIQSGAKNQLKNSIIYLPVIIFIIINLHFLFSSRYFYQDIKPLPPYIPCMTQLQITQAIIKDAHGQKYSLSRIGPFDNYRNQFKYNYDYLLWWEGNEPVEKAEMKYIIVEDQKRTPQSPALKKILETENVSVYYEQNKNLH